MKWLALDIGGANLKAADGQGLAVTQPFAMWECGNYPTLCVRCWRPRPVWITWR